MRSKGTRESECPRSRTVSRVRSSRMSLMYSDLPAFSLSSSDSLSWRFSTNEAAFSGESLLELLKATPSSGLLTALKHVLAALVRREAGPRRRVRHFASGTSC
eukprot:750757-Hanusia_phi.AAC.5